MGVTRAEFQHFIPHAGAMCLLDEVVEWDPSRILCLSRTHRDPANPLRSRGRLHALCGIEYAAQAMAVHGALIAPPGGKPPPGFLVAVRGVVLHVPRLDQAEEALAIEAVRVMGDATSLIYTFAVRHVGEPLLEGRASVVVAAAP